MSESRLIADNVDAPKEEMDDYYSDEDLFKITSWGADLSFRELITRYDDDELVKPELQRNYVWDKTEASRFIDSILLGLPVPSIFLAKTKDEKLLIVDGYQRLMTVRDYVKGIFSKDGKVFKLSRSGKIHKRWKGKAFAELEGEEKRKIKNSTIHAIVFMQRHPEEDDTSMYQVFERINSSGRALFPQEIRNCVYQGPINNLLIDLNNHKNWRSLYGKEETDERMRDMEYILRFFALSDSFIFSSKNQPVRISLKKYLNEFMGKHNNINFIDDFRFRFLRSIDVAKDIFGNNAFFNISQTDDTKLVKKFNPTLFDSVLISIDRALKSNVEFDKNKLVKRRLRVLKDDLFQERLSKETMKIENIRYRINTMFDVLFGNI